MTDLASRIETVVRDVPGVVSLFSTEPAIARSAKQLLPGETSLVAISGDGESQRIVVSVGVDGAMQAPTTAATIAAAIRAALPVDSAAEISVRVSRVVR